MAKLRAKRNKTKTTFILTAIPRISKLNGVPQSFEGKFFGLPFKLINQYTIDNKVEILFYDNRPKGEIVAIIKDNSQLDMIIDSVASWLFKNEDITNLSSYNEKDLKEVHKKLKPFLSNLLQEVKKYNKKPVTKKIKPAKKLKPAKKTRQKITEYANGGGVDDKKMYEITFEDIFSFATIVKTAQLTNSQYQKAIQQMKNKDIVVNKFNEKQGIREQLRIKKITPKFKVSKKTGIATRGKVTTSAKQTGSSNLIYDKRKKAKAPGKRISESGNTYYEYRRNRSDLPGSLTGLYFKKSEILSLDDLKKVYKNLAKKLHPDKGGDTASFQAMQNEYDLLVNEILKTGNLSAQQVKNEVELDEIYKEIINALIPYENLNIEIIGTWIWLSGSFNDLAPLTKKYGNGLLDSLGFKWASLKKMYYLDTTGKGTKNKKEMSIESIRNKYGTKEIKTGKAKLNGVEDKNLIALFKKLKLRLKKRKGYLTKI